MNLDELKLAWETLDRRLDTTVRLNQQLVIAAKLGRVKGRLRPLTVALSLEAVTAFCMLLGLGSFLFRHAAEARFAWPAALLDVWLIASLAGTIRQLVFISLIDYEQPVVAIQKRIEALGLLRLHIIRWALITGPIVWWLPFLVVAFKALFDLDVYRTFGDRFLYINGLASGVVLPLLIWLSKKFRRHIDHSVFLRKVVRYVEGDYIHNALNSLTAISAFESEANG